MYIDLIYNIIHRDNSPNDVWGKYYGGIYRDDPTKWTNPTKESAETDYYAFKCIFRSLSECPIVFVEGTNDYKLLHSECIFANITSEIKYPSGGVMFQVNGSIVQHKFQAYSLQKDIEGVYCFSAVELPSPEYVSIHNLIHDSSVCCCGSEITGSVIRYLNVANISISYLNSTNNIAAEGSCMMIYNALAYRFNFCHFLKGNSIYGPSFYSWDIKNDSYIGYTSFKENNCSEPLIHMERLTNSILANCNFVKNNIISENNPPLIVMNCIATFECCYFLENHAEYISYGYIFLIDTYVDNWTGQGEYHIINNKENFMKCIYQVVTSVKPQNNNCENLLQYHYIGNSILSCGISLVISSF